MRAQSRSGFTLIEMSVVLAIVGVLIGGVLAGQYLVRQAQIQSISKDLTKYKAAYFQFKQQYNGLPGDIMDAESYWGTDPNGCPTNTVYTPRKETCNGNGDNSLTLTTESFRAWQQLSDAQLVEGTFSGVAGAGGTQNLVPGQNGPAGKLPNSGYYMFTKGAVTGDTNTSFYNAAANTYLIFGIKTSTTWPYGVALTAREQYNLDLKMDDGHPSTGAMLTFKSALASGCTTSDVSGSAAYALTTGGPACSIIYLLEQ